jgi:hypothetical protein
VDRMRRRPIAAGMSADIDEVPILFASRTLGA